MRDIKHSSHFFSTSSKHQQLLIAIRSLFIQGKDNCSADEIKLLNDNGISNTTNLTAFFRLKKDKGSSGYYMLYEAISRNESEMIVLIKELIEHPNLSKSKNKLVQAISNHMRDLIEHLVGVFNIADRNDPQEPADTVLAFERMQVEKVRILAEITPSVHEILNEIELSDKFKEMWEHQINSPSIRHRMQ